MTPMSECRLRVTSASTAASLGPTRPRMSEKIMLDGTVRVISFTGGSTRRLSVSGRWPRREDRIEIPDFQDLVALQLVAQAFGVVPPRLLPGRVGKGLPSLGQTQAPQDLPAVRRG